MTIFLTSSILDLKLSIYNFFLEIILKYIFLVLIQNIFIASFVSYFILILFNFLTHFIHIKKQKLNHRFLSNKSTITSLKELDYSLLYIICGDFIFKIFTYLIAIFFISKHGIIHNICSFFIINFLLDIAFIPILSIIICSFNTNINKLHIFSTAKITTIMEILFSFLIYIFINKIIFNIISETGIIFYSLYIYKILVISISLMPLSYLLPIYLYCINKHLLARLYHIFNITTVTILMIILSNIYNLNGIFFSIPLSFIFTNLLYIIVIVFINQLQSHKLI